MNAKQRSVGAIAAALLLAAWWAWSSPLDPEPGIDGPSAETSEPEASSPTAGTIGTKAARSPVAPADGDGPADAGVPPGAGEASDAARSFGSLRLRVVWDSDKAPAAGVWMRLYPRGADDAYHDTIDLRTDGNGEASIDRVHAGRVAVQFDRGSKDHVEVLGGREITATLEIRAGFSARGTVIDFDGRPFAGAGIYVQVFGDSHDGFVVARSSGDGSFAIRDLADRTTVAVSALAAGRAPTRQQLCSAEPGATVALRLAFESTGGALAGRVSGPDGSTIADARVLIGPRTEGAPVALGDGTLGRPPISQLLRTDARGEFLFDGLGPGKHPVRVRASGFAPWSGEAEIAAGRTRALDVTLQAGSSLTGVVRDESGAPLADVEVWADSAVAFASTFRRTRADGSFAMRDLPLHEFTVAADGGDRGYAETRLLGVAGADLRWDPVLTAGARLRVRLAAPPGELAGWRITAEEEPSSVEGYADTRTTDSEGRIEFVNVPDVDLRLCLRAPGRHSFPRAVMHGVRARDREVVIVPDQALEPTVHLRGRVLDPEGKPMGGVRVAPMNPRLFYPPFAVTDAQTGRFEFGPLPAGEWSIHGSAPGFVRLRSASASVDAGVSWDFGDLELEHGGTVLARIAVDGEAGRVQPLVVLRDGSGEQEELAVEGELARSGLLAPGRYTLIARDKGFAEFQVELDVRSQEETKITVALRRL